VQHPSEVVKKGDAVDVIILNIDSDNKRISLGLKQATEDPWLTIAEKLPVGTEQRSRVLRPVDKGIVLDLGNDIEGFAPVSQMGISSDQNPAEAVVLHQEVITRVIEVDPIHHRVVVAIIEYPEDGIPAPGTSPKLSEIPITPEDQPIPENLDEVMEDGE
jgi:small subunit ribosomal protein S1